MQTELESRELILCRDKADLADRAAKLLAIIVAGVHAENRICTVALSGGSTPKMLYERLLQKDFAGSIDWSKVAFYVSDERCVPHASEDSNYGNAFRQLIQPLKLGGDNLHPTIGQEKDADESASNYEVDIRKNVKAGANGLPRFDVIFLGMGPDGHTASLFPGTEALGEEKRLVVKNHVDKVKADRLTFTFPLLNSAANVVFLVAGDDKAEVLSEVVNGASKYPSERVNPVDGTLTWFIERSAASRLKP